MSFGLSQSGIQRVKRSLHLLAERSPRLLVSTVKEVNKRHAKAFRRRRIPRNTGRLEMSLATTNHPDRFVEATIKGVRIGTRVPYAKYQRARIAPLSPQELREIFVNPMLEHVQELLKGGQ